MNSRRFTDADNDVSPSWTLSSSNKAIPSLLLIRQLRLWLCRRCCIHAHSRLWHLSLSLSLSTTSFRRVSASSPTSSISRGHRISIKIRAGDCAYMRSEVGVNHSRYYRRPGVVRSDELDRLIHVRTCERASRRLCQRGCSLLPPDRKRRCIRITRALNHRTGGRRTTGRPRT